MNDQLSAGKASVGYLGLVRGNRDFRYLWLGQIISLLGDWFNLIASAALITTLTKSGLAIGGLFAVRMLAPFLISPVAGVMADRFDRRKLLIVTDITRAVTVLGFLLVREPGHVWLLYALTAIQLAISGVFFPTRNAILPDLVAPRELGAANALSSATWSVMLAVGAALGGLVAGGWGIYQAFVIDAFTFVFSALLLLQISPQSGHELEGEGSQVARAVRQYRSGLRYLGNHSQILIVSLSKAAMGFTVSGAFEVIQVTLSESVFVIGEGGSTGLGILYMTAGIGTGLGPILARRFTGDDLGRLAWVVPLSFLTTAAGLWMIAPLQSFGWVLAGGLLRSVGGGINWVMTTQILLLLLPDEVRGRVFASEFALFTLATAASAGGIGAVLDATPLGLSGVLRLQGMLACIPAVLWLVWLLRSRRQRGAPPIKEIRP
jgi:MFS family permease